MLSKFHVPLACFWKEAFASSWLSNTSEHELSSTWPQSLSNYPSFNTDAKAQPLPTHCARQTHSTLLLNLGSTSAAAYNLNLTQPC